MLFDTAARREIERVAKQYGVEPAKLLAVAWVESAGRPFWRIKGRYLPAIRPEGHYFYKRLSGAKRNRAVAEGLAAKNAGVVTVPSSYEAVYAMLDRMAAIDENAALESISMGLGQVMGAWWKDLGYASVKAMWEECCNGIAGQVTVMMRYIVEYKLLDELKAGKWAEFAKGYNGPGYRKNRYDTKLAKAYKDFLAGTMEAKTERAITKKLSALGYAADASPKRAVEQFQRDRGLVDDGDAGPMTMQEIDKAVVEQKQAKAPVNAGVAAGVGTAAATAAVKAGPDIIESVTQGSDVASSVESIGYSIGLPTIIIGVVVAVALGVFVWYLVRRSRAPVAVEAPA